MPPLEDNVYIRPLFQIGRQLQNRRMCEGESAQARLMVKDHETRGTRDGMKMMVEARNSKTSFVQPGCRSHTNSQKTVGNPTKVLKLTQKIPHTGNTRTSRPGVIQNYRFYTMSLSKYHWCHESMSIQ